MDNVRSLLQDAVSDFAPRSSGIDRMLDRARKRRMRSRLTAAAVATIVAASGIGFALWTFSSGTPVAAPTHGPTRFPTHGATHGAVQRGCQHGWTEFSIPPLGNRTNIISGVAALSATDAWAVGWYTQVPAAFLSPQPPGSHGPGPPTLNVPVALHWDGAHWTSVDVPNEGVIGAKSGIPQGGVRLLAVAALSPSDVWAVGGGQGPVIEHWDGVQWSIVPSPSVNLVNEELVSVAASGPDDAWAIGSGGDGGAIAPVIEHWDGSSWSVAPTPDAGTRFSELHGIDALSPTDAWAVGQAWDQPLALHWDGTSWTRVQVPNLRATSLYGVAQLGPDIAWAVGTDYADVDGNGPDHAVIVRWNGASWRRVDTPLSEPDSHLLDISAWGRNEVWARGGVSPGLRDLGTQVLLRLNGGSWNVVSAPANPPDTDSWSGIGAAPDGSVWLVGSTSTRGQYPAGSPFVGRSCGT
jgi:hypothetical protein